jgi:hypothetical protein
MGLDQNGGRAVDRDIPVTSPPQKKRLHQALLAALEDLAGKPLQVGAAKRPPLQGLGWLGKQAQRGRNPNHTGGRLRV